MTAAAGPSACRKANCDHQRHTADDNYQKNGGDAGASWSLHYAVTKTSGTRNGQVGPFTTQEAADAAANSARDAAIAELQGEAQNAVNNAIAAAKAQLGSIQFRYEEITVPYGFGKYWGTNGSSQTISVPANTNNDYVMKNDEWSLQVNLKKTDSETGSQIVADAQYEIYQWDVVTGKYQPLAATTPTSCNVREMAPIRSSTAPPMLLTMRCATRCITPSAIRQVYPCGNQRPCRIFWGLDGH